MVSSSKSFLRPKDLNAHFRAIDELAGLFGRSMTPPMEDDVVSSIPSSGPSSPCSEAEFHQMFASSVRSNALASMSLLESAATLHDSAGVFASDDFDFLSAPLDVCLPDPASRKRGRAVEDSESLLDGPAKARRRCTIRPPVAPSNPRAAVPHASMQTVVVVPHRAAKTVSVDSVFTPSSGSHATQKRDQHNVSERLRRQGLKSSFEDLRLCVPALDTVSNAHTGQILEGAVDYINFLQAQEKDLLRAKAELRAQIAANRILFA